MDLKQISIAEALSKSSGTPFFSTFVQLVGKTNDAILYEGIKKEDAYLIAELEDKLNTSISSNYIDFLKITNGAVVSGMKYYSLTDKDNIDSIYYRNYISDTRKKYKIPDSYLIIGETDNGLICYESDEDDGSFTLMDIYNKEKLDFYYLEDLFNFRFYFRLILMGKKKKIEQDKLEKAKKKLKDELLLQHKANNKKKSSKNGMIAKKPNKDSLSR